jgi:hypothetical protein
MKNLATIGLAGLTCMAMLSGALAADTARPSAPPAAAPVVHPLLHPVLWCAGGVVVSVVVHNPIPAIVGCSVGAVELVHQTK